MAHLVTRYNKNTNNLDVIGIGSDGTNALNLVTKDIEKNSGRIINRQYGSPLPYSMKFVENGVQLTVNSRVLLVYTITGIPRNQLVEVTNF